jgi:putative heme-binding domain-containing protein
LIVTARMPVKRSTIQMQFIAQAIVNIEPKIQARKLEQDSSWSSRIMEMCTAHVELAPDLPVAMMRSPNFGSPGHVAFVQLLQDEDLEQCAAIFLKHLQNKPDYVWNSDLVYLLGAVDSEETRALLRTKFDDLSLRNAILASFASDPQESDRKLFVDGLQYGNIEAMLLCIETLHLLSPTTDGHENVVLATSLRKLGDHGDERMARDQTIELLRRNLRMEDTYILGKDGESQGAAISKWIAVVEERFPREHAAITRTDIRSLDELKNRLAKIHWQGGDAANGWKLFQSRSCAQCHGQSGALGPDLTGITGRFSRDDLFTAIVFPSQDVPLRYQGIQVVTTEGHVRSGMTVYEGLDGIVLRDALNHTFRIEADQIEEKHPMKKSLMPEGLLEGLTDRDLVDLYAYLQSLGAKSTAAGETTSTR